MSTIILEYPREDAKTLVKAAFELTKGIKTYNDEGIRIVGKTGFRLGSYGENVIVGVPENQSSEDQTTITVNAEKSVDMNITANPQKYESRFIEQLNQLRGREINEVLDLVNQRISVEDSKEVASVEDQASGENMVIWIIVLTFILFFLMWIIMLP